MSDRAFDRAMSWILAAEGNYSNDPKDPGGETRWGISKRAFPGEDIANLTRDRAEQLYREHYWKTCRCDELPEPIALAVFDAAVNQGPGVGIRLLQKALGLTADGAIGPATIDAARTRPIQGTLTDFICRRFDRYFDLEGASVFLRGWTRRLFRLQAECLLLAALKEAS